MYHQWRARRKAARRPPSQTHDLSGSLATVADPLYRDDVHQPLLYTQRSYLSADCDGMPLRRCLNPG